MSCFEKKEEINENIIDTPMDQVSDSDSDSEENSVECRLAQKAFNITHIAELIFSKCDRQTLLNCRAVSSPWAYLTSKELQKTVALDFRQPDGRKLREGQDGGPLRISMYGSSNETLSGLISLLSTATEFPCTTFAFYVQNPLLDFFFEEVGDQVRKLTLYGHIPVGTLNRILFRQAPNLEHFELNGGVKEDEENDPENENENNNDAVDIVEANLSETMDWVSQQSPKNVQINLKTLQFRQNKKTKSCEIPLHLFQEILKASPNLSSVEVPSEFIHFLINDLHLVKNLKIKISEKTIKSLEQVTNENRILKLQSLQKLDLTGLIELMYKTPPGFVEKGVEVLKKILKCASNTCMELRWCQMPYLKTENIPIMSQVRRLSLLYSYSYHGNPSRLQPGYLNRTQFFPQKIVMKDAFPNLEVVTIKTKGRLTLKISTAIKLTDLFHLQGRPHPGVRRVVWVGTRPTNETFLESFPEIFPNAKFSTVAD